MLSFLLKNILLYFLCGSICVYLDGYHKPVDFTCVYPGVLLWMHIDIYTRIKIWSMDSPGQGTLSGSKKPLSFLFVPFNLFIIFCNCW